MDLSPTSIESCAIEISQDFKGSTAISNVEDLKLNARIGLIDIEYSNQFLKSLCEIITPYKSIHSFRYTPISTMLLSFFEVSSATSLYLPFNLLKRACIPYNTI